VEQQQRSKAAVASGLADGFEAQVHDVRQQTIYMDWAAKQGQNGARGSDAMQQNITKDAGKAVGGHSGTHASFRTYLTAPEKEKDAYINQEKVQHNFNLSNESIARENSPLVKYKGDSVPTAAATANGPKVAGATPFAGPATLEVREFMTDPSMGTLSGAIREEAAKIRAQDEACFKYVHHC
jgi:hypothetical protein